MREREREQAPQSPTLPSLGRVVVPFVAAWNSCPQVAAQLSVLLQRDGLRRMHTLRLVRSLAPPPRAACLLRCLLPATLHTPACLQVRSHHPLVRGTWTLMHTLDDASPLAGLGAHSANAAVRSVHRARAPCRAVRTVPCGVHHAIPFLRCQQMPVDANRCQSMPCCAMPRSNALRMDAVSCAFTVSV